MNSGAMRLLTAATAAALLSAACAGSGLPGAEMGAAPAGASDGTTTTTIPEATQPGLPDITAVDFSVDDLLEMLPVGDTGVAGTDERANGVRSNEDLVLATVRDGDDETADVVRFGRITGVVGTYPGALGTAHVWIDLLPDSDAAHEYLVDTSGDIAKGEGGTHDPTIRAADVTGFPVSGVGEEATGLIVEHHSSGEMETLILSRLGRLVLFASLVRGDETDVRVPVQYLAEEVEDRVMSALTSAVPPRSPDSAPAYRFSYTHTVGWDGGSVTATSEGVVDGDNVSCHVVTNTSSGRVERDLVAVGSSLWARSPGGQYVAVGGANTEIRRLLMLCPAWPISIGAAGLDDALTDAPQRDLVNGLPAASHSGGADQLADVLGSDLEGVEVDTFTFSVREGSSWLVDVTLLADGPASELAPLIGEVDGDLVTLSMRHRVLEMGGGGLKVVPPN